MTGQRERARAWRLKAAHSDRKYGPPQCCWGLACRALGFFTQVQNRSLLSLDSRRWLALTGSGTHSLVWGVPDGKPSSYLGETQEGTEGPSYSSKRVSACLRLNDSAIWHLKCRSLGKARSRYIILFTYNFWKTRL